MSNLPDNLRQTAHKIDTGKPIKLCEETALMYQAADEIQRLEAENKRYKSELLDAADIIDKHSNLHPLAETMRISAGFLPTPPEQSE